MSRARIRRGRAQNLCKFAQKRYANLCKLGRFYHNFHEKGVGLQTLHATIAKLFLEPALNTFGEDI
jgi:hypothetical protein